MWKYLHPQCQDISQEVQTCSVTLSENTLQNAACFQGRGKYVLTQLLVTGDQDGKQCFGDSINLYKILYFCVGHTQNLGPCTSGYKESGFALKRSPRALPLLCAQAPADRGTQNRGSKTMSLFFK